MSSRTSVAPLALLTVVAAACVTEPTLATESQAEAVIGGTHADPGDFPAVVAIYDAGDKTICTGTLVSPTAVLTAAHCVAYGNDDAERTRLIADTEVFIDTVSMFHPIAKVAVDDIVIHPDYIRLADDPEKNGFHDVALIMLGTPITDRRVARVGRTPMINAMGLSYTLVGYGIYEANTGETGRLYSVGDRSIDCSPYGTPNDRFVCFDRADGTGACAGDSGSPLFRPTTSGIRELVGVHSWGSKDGICGGIGADTKIEAEVAFLQAELGDAFLCAADGVCEEACADDDVDCSALPNAVCKSDNECGEHYGCDDGICRELSAMVDLDPTHTVEKIDGGGCSAAKDNIGGGLFLLIASGYLAIARRRR